MKTFLSFAAIFVLSILAGAAPAQQAKPAHTAPASRAPSQTQKNIEAYLRNLYAFGPDVMVSVGPLKDSLVAGLEETNVAVTIGENKQNATFYISRDGKYLLRGEISDLTKDSLAETRAQIQMSDAPMLGDPKAPVTLVEFSDFQCPVCRRLHDDLRAILPNYNGKMRVVFKDFPIEQLHPWARTAAMAGRCAYQQDPKAFWKMYDSIYDHQDLISAENAWTKMTDYASQSELNLDAFKSCMASPQTGEAINASRANGEQLEVTSTPTIFVNGRRFAGADRHVLEQYINYELARQKSDKLIEKN